MKQITGIFALVFAVTLAVIVGREMSAEAMAVIIGVVCGVAAGIPTAVLLLIAFSRREARETRRQEEAQAWHRTQNGPPVIVIQGGNPQALPQGPQAGYWPAPQPGPVVNRQFHVVGGDDLLMQD